MTVDPSHHMPAFEQLKQQISQLRASGELAAGHRLPPVRHLASTLGLAPNTVARAYRELEAVGVIETRGRHGSFVTGTPDTADKAAVAAATEFATTIRSLGVDPAVALSHVRAAFDA